MVANEPKQAYDGDNVPDLIEGESIGSYLIFKLDERLFKFRGSMIPAGQYEFPFSFLIPEKKIPSSFHFISAVGESYSVKYTIQVYFNDLRPLMIQSKEIQIITGMKKKKGQK